MTATTTQQLREYGYKKTDLESLFEALPPDIWITVSEKNIKRQRANFVFTRKNGQYIMMLTVTNTLTAEVFILHKTKEADISEAVGLMILFLEQKKMLGPNI